MEEYSPTFSASPTYFRQWRKDGTWIKIHDSLRDWTRIAQERKCPSEAIIDSQSVKSAAMVCDAVGDDAGKKRMRARRVPRRFSAPSISRDASDLLQ